jgi:ferredoxin/flavodoxin
MFMPKLHLIYFSPTGTTRKTVTGIAGGMGAGQTTTYDLTLPDAMPEAVLKDGAAIIGVPVYAGRVPELFLRRLRGISSCGVPAVLVAVYGNRAFEDALVELRDVATAKGFKVIAAAAFIGEHSFSTSTLPIATGRPDGDDLKLAAVFGERVAAKIARGALDTPMIDGQTPYREGMKAGKMAPETDSAACTLCGACATACPAGAIRVAARVTTDAAGCIWCCACVKACKTGARTLNPPGIVALRERLHDQCGTPKAPRFFL